MERLLANSLFKHSRRYPSMLRYVVEHALSGHTAQVKERTLGIEVFARDPHYDTNLDPVVRTTAGEIRKRIAQYYHEPGHEGELRIDLPVGSYLPEFHQSVKNPALVQPARVRPRWLLISLAAAALAAMVVLAVWFGPWASQPVEQFWRPILNSSSPAVLCIGPANLSAATDPGASTLQEVQRLEAQHVALSDATTLSRIAGLLQLHHKAYHVRNAVFTSFRDLRDGPVILIGAFNNNWTLRLSGPLRYSFGSDAGTHLSWIADRQNPSKRDWVVALRAPVSTVNEDYALISRFWDATTDQPVVIAAGIGIYGTMAAGEFLTDPVYLSTLAKQAPGNWDRKNIQVVIATKVINGVSGPPRILATHFW
ncbi:MAG TPA: hypothetical protein VIX89_04385 [Bryobacteraceae bacterium]